MYLLNHLFILYRFTVTYFSLWDIIRCYFIFFAQIAPVLAIRSSFSGSWTLWHTPSWWVVWPLPYTLALPDVPGSSCIFPARVLESAISLGSPGSFVGNGVRNEGLSTGYAYVSWGVFASWPSQRGRAWNYISVYTHIYNHLSIYSSVSMLSCIWVHTFVSIAKSVFKWFTLAFRPALVYLQIPIPTAESYSNRIVALTRQFS